ncbi:MAG TPA: pectin acetylesterase-family hydrolase [Kofleriaceae bacterium]|jgi:hypothetical protein
MKRAVVVAALFVVACGDNKAPETPDHNPDRGQYNVWEEIELPGTVCGNDSQYKFWVNYSQTSDNLAVVFEPGGACWDYPSCSGATGVRGAANPDGLTDDHYTFGILTSPFLNRDMAESPTQDWNLVYLPYCTGDVYAGNVVADYTDDTGANPPLEWHHEGHNDTMAAIAYLDREFNHIPKMLVTGCSAGGVGSLVNYHFLRQGMHAVQEGYLLDDSGPIFPSPGFSDLMHDKIRSAWNLDSLTSQFPSGFTLDNMGTINTALADTYPNDRLATTFFERDYNFSLYSYDRFYGDPTKDMVMQMWASDTASLVSEYDARPNLYYYLPYWRDINDSHCTTLIEFDGSEIQDHDMTLTQWASDLVNDQPLQSMEEAPVPGEDPPGDY